MQYSQNTPYPFGKLIASALCVFRMYMQMGVEQFINDFKGTGSVITPLALKECENK